MKIVTADSSMFVLRKQALISLLFAYCALFRADCRAQQTVQFTQYTFNGLAVNPAYAGYKDDWNASMSYRMQWTGIDGAPRTGTLSADGPADVVRKNIALGIIATNDRLGPQNTSSVYLNIAYRLRLDANDTRRLSFGIAAGAAQYTLDGSKFTGNIVGDPAVPAGNESTLLPELRAGIFYYSSTVYAGASVINMLSDVSPASANAVTRQIRHVYVTGGALVPLNTLLDLKPSFLVKEDFRGPTNIDLTSYIAFNKQLWVGASWRTAAKLWNKNKLQDGLDQQDAVAALVQLYWKKRFRLGYSFDFTTSKLASYQHGSHELSVSVSFPRKNERILGPRFF